MDPLITMAMLEEATAAIKQLADLTPRVGLILGSGLSPLADAVEMPVRVDFGQIPHFPVSTVQGHSGRLVVGMLERQPVVVMQGRSHYYEGYSMGQIGFPIRVMALLGIQVLIVTNAAGGVNMAYRPGEIMIIRDHINLVGMAGLTPLRGPNLDQFGPRFPSMNDAYDPALRELARKIALDEGIPFQQGVYICLAGPNFESPADVRFLRVIGADAVGMSTVPEVITARHSGIRVLGLSGITNILVGEPVPLRAEGAQPPNHEEVLEAGAALVPRLELLVRGILSEL
ncbi:MAG: purine-nucleoside phosphorylase [Anaerolineae bacterium]|jgi:purine-nucleoside phosphorylase|nr:purine-nucleoside phosphorylase [Anaerolineae bacterium]